MSDTAPDFQALMQRLDSLASSVEELKAARTPTERREAQEDVDSAEAALERYAKAHGISTEDAEEAINAVKRNARKSEIREVLEEIFQEDEAAAKKEAEEAAAKKEAEEEDKEKDKPKPKPKPDAVPETDGHWTERRVFS